MADLLKALVGQAVLVVAVLVVPEQMQEQMERLIEGEVVAVVQLYLLGMAQMAAQVVPALLLSSTQTHLQSQTQAAA